MAWRLDKAIIRGELDNTEKGVVKVRLEVVGYSQPLCLELSGDAWRDVAGSRLSFVNPDPEPQPTAPPWTPLQRGSVGDITASRKVKVFTVPEEEWRQAYMEDRIESVPTEWRNSLYLEWFSDEYGRCLVESADFEIQVSESLWEMDEDEEAAQQMANMHAMREHLCGIIQRSETDEETDPNDIDEESFTEESWEEQLKASDRLTTANLEALEKYGEEDDNEEKIAFVMGWDHIIEDMADAHDGIDPSESDDEEKKRRHEWIEMMNAAAEEGLEDMETEEKEEHPLISLAHEFIHQVYQDMEEAGISDERGKAADHPLERFMVNIMQITGKLSGALGGISTRKMDSLGVHKGYILAITKRCLNWSNEALSALQELATHQDYGRHAKIFEQWQSQLFAIRDGITDLRKELQEE